MRKPTLTDDQKAALRPFLRAVESAGNLGMFVAPRGAEWAALWREFEYTLGADPVIK